MARPRLRAADRATNSALGSLLTVGVVVLLATTLAVGLVATSDVDEIARQARSVVRCGRATC